MVHAFRDLNAPFTDEIGQWSWRDWYYTINVTNFTLSRLEEDNSILTEQKKRIKGQMLFLRGLAYYNLAGYYQNPILITDYATYSTLDGLYGTNSTYDEVWDQVEQDFSEAMTLLPSRNEGGEWAKGRATCGSAAGYYARALMMRHKYSDALTVLKNIINGQYGTYKLMANYGDNFREGAAYENNDESLFEIQYLDYGSQEPTMSGLLLTPVLTLLRDMLSRVTSVLATSVDGLTSLHQTGCMTCLRRSAQQVVHSTHASIGLSVHTRTSGKVSNSVMYAMEVL